MILLVKKQVKNKNRIESKKYNLNVKESCLKIYLYKYHFRQILIYRCPNEACIKRGGE